MSSLTKNIYRKKILRHLNPTKYLEKRINKEKHIALYLFKRSSLKFRLKYDNVIDESKTLIIVNEYNENVILASRNLQKVAVATASEVSALDVVSADKLLIEEL